MTTFSESDILEKKISKMKFSKEFKVSSIGLGYDTLQQIIATDPTILQKKKGFNYVWFGELVEFLVEKKLLHLLQPKQGNNGI
ncbi:hypothetical protein [Mucilaginibacter sp. FT3.2]|uniref:hypothetical protein n=1 Tax=Mucilaginibacter sp. FT3.2 TaxID=2723090 RepID=UPI00161A8B0E|nr:hypothetical protein [Mucilaginibacter sp. FT3.2]MBB6235295.1 hypothetical protein [Mucilaginibacter sp. FT3.2]